MSFKLIKVAAKQLNEQTELNNHIVESLTEIAEENETTFEELSESVTHVLANIAATALGGKELTIMTADSVSAFMAGVEKIASLLPAAQDPAKVANTLKILQNAGIGPDGLVNTSVAPIAQVGNSSPARQKYADLIKSYMMSVQSGKADGGPLAQAARKLQATIDQAMRSTSAGQPQPDQPQATTSMRQGMMQK